MMTNHLKEILKVLALNKNDEWQHELGSTITDYEEQRKWQFLGYDEGCRLFMFVNEKGDERGVDRRYVIRELMRRLD